jgi:ABC-2 type transport system permease protein
MVMFVFLNLLVSGVGIAEERRRGLLRRLGMAPVSKREIVLGKLLARVFIGWIQIGWLLFIGRVLYRIEWADHGWLLFAFLSLFALASASLGLFFGTLFRDPDKCRAAAIWTAILLAPLGGLWWPIEIVGPTMRRISYFVPTGWAMEPVNAMLAFGAGAREVAPFAAAFAALFVVTFVAASRRLEIV